MEVKSDNNQRQHLQELNQDLRNQILAKKREIDAIKKMHKLKREDTIVVEQDRIQKVHDSYNQKQLEALNHKESKLQKLKESFNQTKNLLDQELKNYQNVKEDQMDQVTQRYHQKNNQTIEQAHQESRELIDQTRERIQQLRFETDQNINNRNYEAQQRLQQISNQNELEIARMNDHYDRIKQETIKEHQNFLQNEQRQLDRELQEIERHKHNTQNKDAQFSADYIRQRREYYQEKMNESDQHFQRRFQDLQNEQRQLLTRTLEEFSKQINDVINDYSQTKKSIETKQHDSFYKLTKLEPLLSDHGDHYILTLEVPEHEKDNVILNAYNRNIKLSLTRSHSEVLRNEETNSVNRSKRSEVFIKEFPSEDILDPRGITQSYEEGLLHFKIMKA